MEPLFWSQTATLKTQGTSASLARAFVRRELLAHHLPALVDYVRLVVNELAHVLITEDDTTSFTVLLRGGCGEVLLQVQDGSSDALEHLVDGHHSGGPE